MKGENKVINRNIDDPIIVVELLSHYGEGFKKSLVASKNFVTKGVCFTVQDQIKAVTNRYSDLETAINEYDKIKKVD
jgi:hypothetical protein